VRAAWGAWTGDGTLSRKFTMIDRVRKTRIKIWSAFKSLLETLHGLDFTAQVYPHATGLDPAIAYKSSPSGNKYLEAVLNDLKITSADAIIDVGCGKGSAMRTMLKYPFSVIDGVELSDPIASVARRNFDRLKAGKCSVFTMNAADFDAYDPYNLVYFYNPFPAAVMAKVMEHISGSLRRVPRRVVIIYDNPQWGGEILKKKAFRKTNEYPDEWGNRIFIYTNILQD
jgi:SAM-dependent methyltransferase